MTSIRRLPPGISTSITRSTLDVEPTAPLAPREPVEPVKRMRHGFSEESEFQADGAELDAGLLSSYAPNPGGFSTDGFSEPGGAALPQHLRVFSGESSFEAAAPRYSQRLGSQLPAALGAPREAEPPAFPGLSSRGSAEDPSVILSPEVAAWELHTLDTSTPTVDEPEDLLFMLDPPGSAGADEPIMELGLEDIFEEAPLGTSATGDVDTTPTDGATGDVDNAPGDVADGFDPTLPFMAEAALLDASVRPAGPEEFLADTHDLGDLVTEEPSVQLSPELASREVEVVADAGVRPPEPPPEE